MKHFDKVQQSEYPYSSKKDYYTVVPFAIDHADTWYNCRHMIGRLPGTCIYFPDGYL
jgi:hypothetical protein